MLVTWNLTNPRCHSLRWYKPTHASAGPCLGLGRGLCIADQEENLGRWHAKGKFLIYVCYGTGTLQDFKEEETSKWNTCNISTDKHIYIYILYTKPYSYSFAWRFMYIHVGTVWYEFYCHSEFMMSWSGVGSCLVTASGYLGQLSCPC